MKVGDEILVHTNVYGKEKAKITRETKTTWIVPTASGFDRVFDKETRRLKGCRDLVRLEELTPEDEFYFRTSDAIEKIEKINWHIQPLKVLEAVIDLISK